MVWRRAASYHVAVTRALTTEARAVAVLPKPESVSFEEISRAELRIQDGIVQTPTIASPLFSEITGMDISFKVDSRQMTGSFKERGARNALMQLSPQQKERGVVCASAGNHAQAMAYHGRDLGIDITCVMPIGAPLNKVNKCRDYGANVMLHGAHIGESFEHAMSLVERDDSTYINGFDHPHIIAGAGTMALEILKQAPDTEVLVVPVGGAGLIAGIALAIKTLKPGIEIVGAEPKNCASFTAALQNGEVCQASVKPTLADGLAVPQVGLNAFHIAKDLVDRVVVVGESDIAITVLRLLEMEKLVVEGGGATGLAAILSGQLDDLKGKKVVVPLCGGNIDVNMLGRVIDRGLAADKRLIRFSVLGDDKAGGLARITETIGITVGACIKDVHHERAWVEEDLFYVENQFVVETTGEEHANLLKATLLEQNYSVKWGSDDHWQHPHDKMVNTGSIRDA